MLGKLGERGMPTRSSVQVQSYMGSDCIDSGMGHNRGVVFCEE
jgi:hypothetical protein